MKKRNKERNKDINVEINKERKEKERTESKKGRKIFKRQKPGRQQQTKERNADRNK